MPRSLSRAQLFQKMVFTKRPNAKDFDVAFISSDQRGVPPGHRRIIWDSRNGESDVVREHEIHQPHEINRSDRRRRSPGEACQQREHAVWREVRERAETDEDVTPSNDVSKDDDKGAPGELQAIDNISDESLCSIGSGNHHHHHHHDDNNSNNSVEGGTTYSDQGSHSGCRNNSQNVNGRVKERHMEEADAAASRRSQVKPKQGTQVVTATCHMTPSSPTRKMPLMTQHAAEDNVRGGRSSSNRHHDHENEDQEGNKSHRAAKRVCRRPETIDDFMPLHGPERTTTTAVCDDALGTLDNDLIVEQQEKQYQVDAGPALVDCLVQQAKQTAAQNCANGSYQDVPVVDLVRGSTKQSANSSSTQRMSPRAPRCHPPFVGGPTIPRTGRYSKALARKSVWTDSRDHGPATTRSTMTTTTAAAAPFYQAAAQAMEEGMRHSFPYAIDVDDQTRQQSATCYLPDGSAVAAAGEETDNCPPIKSKQWSIEVIDLVDDSSHDDDNGQEKKKEKKMEENDDDALTTIEPQRTMILSQLYLVKQGDSSTP